MSPRPRGGLHVVKGRAAEPDPEPEFAGDIYAEARAAALDADRWRRCHVRCHRSEPIYLPDNPVRRVVEPGRSVKEFRP